MTPKLPLPRRFRLMRRTLAALAALALGFPISEAQADLADVKARGELRHLGVRYANFVTPEGKGFDVEIIQGFARHLGVRYVLVESDFVSVIRDLLGKNVVRQGDQVYLEGSYPVRGDLIASGFTVLPWREQVVLFSQPTFPSQVFLITRSEHPQTPLKSRGHLDTDISRTKALLPQRSLLVMEKTCLDPANYALKNRNIDLRPYQKSTDISEMIPALLAGEAEYTLLDVPDIVIDLQRWPGRFKIIGPISEEQALAAAFPKDAPELRQAFNQYLLSLRRDGSYDRLVNKYYPGIRRYFPSFFAATEP